MDCDDPLSITVAAEVSWLIDHLARTKPDTFSRFSFVDIDGRVWIDRMPDDSGRFIFWHLFCDPLDGGDGEKVLALTFEFQRGMRVMSEDTENLFWWAMWLASFRASKTAE